jgi:hypothetical protein
MVAEAIAKNSTPKYRRESAKLCPKIPLSTRVKARNLYVLQQISAREVAEQCGLKEKQVYTLAQREGWVAVRKARKLSTEQALDARIANDSDELVEAVALQSAEMTLETFKAAKEALDAGGDDAARNVQAYSQATKNYVGLYRQAKSLDVAAQQGNTTNVLFISCARAGVNEPSALPVAPTKAEPINVTPVAAPVTQVASEA